MRVRVDQARKQRHARQIDVFVPAGAETSAAGPAETIFSPLTSTTHPACGAAVVPSNTRSGRSRMLCAACAAEVRQTATKRSNAIRFDIASDYYCGDDAAARKPCGGASKVMGSPW